MKSIFLKFNEAEGEPGRERCGMQRVKGERGRGRQVRKEKAGGGRESCPDGGG